MRKVRETETEIIFSVDAPEKLSSDTIDSLFVPGKALRIEWPRQSIEISKFAEISKNYFVQIGMEAKNLIFQTEVSSLTVKTLDDQTTSHLVSRSYEQTYADVWRGQISDEILNRFRQGVAGLSQSKNTRFVEVDGQVRGLIIVANFQTYRGENKDHLAWIWIDAELPQVTRRAIGNKLLQAASELAPGQILAGVYIHNMKSYSFLRKAGFESICATFLRP